MENQLNWTLNWIVQLIGLVQVTLMYVLTGQSWVAVLDTENAQLKLRAKTSCLSNKRHALPSREWFPTLIF